MRYHEYNDLFDTKAFKASITKAQQTLSFCRVNAYYHNGKAEKVKDVTEGVHTSLLHAVHRCLKTVSPSLWPAALKDYVKIKNSLPTRFIPCVKEGRRKLPAWYDSSPIFLLSGTEVEANISQSHPFGSPIHVLENSLQSQKSCNKWSDRSRVGIFMCHSPNHYTSVTLVLNTQSGNVSPQFHCIYNNDLNTCKRDSKFQSLWQSKAKLQTVSKVTSTIDVLPSSISESESDFPESSDPLPCFVVPGNVEFTIQTDVDKLALPTVPNLVEPVVTAQQH